MAPDARFCCLETGLALVEHLRHKAGLPPPQGGVSIWTCGCSSGVEHDLAKVGVEGSNPFARSRHIRFQPYLLKSCFRAFPTWSLPARTPQVTLGRNIRAQACALPNRMDEARSLTIIASPLTWRQNDARTGEILHENDFESGARRYAHGSRRWPRQRSDRER